MFALEAIHFIGELNANPARKFDAIVAHIGTEREAEMIQRFTNYRDSLAPGPYRVFYEDLLKAITEEKQE